jgi:sorting nexin-29
MGFRANGTTTSNIYMIWQIYEKCHEHNIAAYNLFIDFKQAFDSVNRVLVHNCLKLFNVPSELSKWINIILQHTKAKVETNDLLQSKLQDKTFIRQNW